ncbi:hypothetical protein BOS5A_210300 [Bosea sp. EC-HK365B]|nr:hypothetical protein BOSE7B_120163 [Bosea sp. 7B]CAD5279710.1 hypothetical protein BOSE21B_30753 [Bosea sp. 21B]VVT59509.1 hypothetical protein BOS5A_210300 [Bosea sp. EC-HK365B]VXB93976.1 hypothetical protein BOSE127_160193 [Bosea sp. 127]
MNPSPTFRWRPFCRSCLQRKLIGTGSSVATMLAAADDFDHLIGGLEVPAFGHAPDRLTHRRRGVLVDASADLADQERHRLIGAMAVRAGDEGVARTQTVHETLLNQEVERPIDRDRREATSTRRRDPVRQIIGADRFVVGIERLQRLAPDRRQAQAALAADLLGPRQSGGGVARMIVRMLTETMLMIMGVIVVMGVTCRLHFRHVALQ